MFTFYVYKIKYPLRKIEIKSNTKVWNLNQITFVVGGWNDVQLHRKYSGCLELPKYKDHLPKFFFIYTLKTKTKIWCIWCFWMNKGANSNKTFRWQNLQPLPKATKYLIFELLILDFNPIDFNWNSYGFILLRFMSLSKGEIFLNEVKNRTKEYKLLFWFLLSYVNLTKWELF